MKKLLYKLYAFLFNISAVIFPVKENRIAFVSMHNENFRDSLGNVYERLKRENRYDFVLITREDLSVKKPLKVFSFFFIKSRLLATSKYVFLNDNFMPMGKMNFSKSAVITQLWHGEGAFKKFGLHIPQPEDLRKREIAANRKLTYVVCSSEGVRRIYAEAFGVEEIRVLPLGAPRLDYLADESNKAEAKKKILALYPEAKDKKIILYAPTFRDDEERDGALLDSFSDEKLLNELGEEYFLFIRLHPQIHTADAEFKAAADVTDYEDVRELILVSDILITDYSSICMDFCALDKKTVFYCPDLSRYRERRDFYFDYEAFVPGRVCKNFEDLAEAVKAPFCEERNSKFKKMNFDYTDTQNTDRVIKAVMGLSQ
ncbi:MAG: CDP-glycerol glycerophosphotransferase family protein [Clostridia bacterium]|nr:CDP-glycerol glycerophosphotransferase family protein [Clostridia bacterium]